MRVLLGTLGAIALTGLSLSASAQGLPPGSYQQSCEDIRMRGSTLIAICRTTDGRGMRTALDVADCSGDIGNDNGQLQCNGGQSPTYSGGGYSRPYSGQGYPPQYGNAPGPGYAPPGYGYGPPPR